MEAHVAAPPAQAGFADSARSIPPRDPGRYALLDECRELVATRLSRVIRETVDKLGEQLAMDARKSSDVHEQSLLLDAVDLLRLHREEIEQRFRRSFNTVFERRLFSKRDVAQDAAIDASQLSLVSEESMEESLAVERIVNRARGRLDPDEVLGVRARFGALLERDWFEEDQHPAAPEAVFEALKNTLAELAARSEVTNRLLEAFEPHVAGNLNGIYTKVNERLKASQILPTIQRQVHNAGTRTTKPDGEAPQAGAPGPDARALADGAAGAAPPGGGEADAMDAFHALIERLEKGIPTAKAQATRMLVDPEAFGLADLPVSPAEPPLLQALTHLQQTAHAGPNAHAKLIEDLGDRVREQGSPLDQLTVEIVSIVFDYIYSDPRLPDPIKQQLLRMQVVAVKAALIDRSFFARRQHPMRRLIDRMTELGADPEVEVGPESLLVRGLAEIVDWILENFDNDLGTFQQALARIEELGSACAEQRQQWLAKRTDEARRHELLVNAEEDARAQIALRIDPETPELVREFLYRWWAQVMARGRIAEDPVLSWDDGLRVVEGLLWSVAPKTGEEIQRLAALLPKLIGALMTGLKTIEYPNEEREVFFNELLRAHTRMIEAVKAPGAARRPKNPEARMQMDSQGVIRFMPKPRSAAMRAAEEEAEAERARALSGLVRGAAVEVMQADGEFLRYKLAWISPAQKVFVLSRYPEDSISYARDDLARLLASGRVRRVEEASVLDRAIEHVAQEESAAA
ncbi:MAG: DUF1631 family protein [Burkholderiales bacterium]|nr:MAG: DUF1631 family protein [Burkholderiales bacterium]